MLKRHHAEIRDALIRDVDAAFGVFVDGHFNQKRFLGYCSAAGIVWPLLSTGRPALDDETFSIQSSLYPELRSLHELRKALSLLRPNGLAVGKDGRARTMLSAFSSKTGRNQPSTSSNVFGMPSWARGLVQPKPGTALAYLDYCQQEFGIAAALSRDRVMQEAYLSGDPYLAFAKQAGAVPPNATKTTHPVERERFKQCVLAVQYGMEERSLAKRIGQPIPYSRWLLNTHRKTYPTFWRWSDSIEQHAQITGELRTVFGWTIWFNEHTGERTLKNFPMQANGADMLRIACCIATDRGVRVLALVHDAMLIEAPEERIDDVVSRCRMAMDIASRLVLGEFCLRTDVEIVRYPDRLVPDRGRAMWDRVYRLAQEQDARSRANTCAPASTPSVSSKGSKE